MAFTEAPASGDLNGTTTVDLLAGPGSGRRVVALVNICNVDTIAHDVTIFKHDGTTARAFFGPATLQPNESISLDGPIILAATGQKIQAKCAEAVGTVNPTFEVSYAEVT